MFRSDLLTTITMSVLLAFGLSPLLADTPSVTCVDQIPSSSQPPHYTANRPPLAPSRLLKLPIGSIRPNGWLRHMLELEAQGMSGRLAEISPWLTPDGNPWADPQGQGRNGWEELPYWLKGYGDLGYVLQDKHITAEARTWIERVLASQRQDGWFGPRDLLTAIDGKPDLWPHMVMLNALQSWYEYNGDERIPPFMARYFRWQLACRDTDFMQGYWAPIRLGDNLESVYWLYNRTGDPWLLELARKLQRHAADWTSGVPDWHGVNIAQAFREPAIYFLQANDLRFLDAAERNYTAVTSQYGQVPGGMYGADENCRPGYSDPRQATETCAMVEFMHSAQLLTRISGTPVWADRCEDVAFNSFPAATTADLKALRYLTSPNLVQADHYNKSPGIQNGGMMFAYSPHDYRCCQHNVAFGWPYYAEELWQATADHGLCASLYAASEVTAKVGEVGQGGAAGDGRQVTLTEQTDYPFSDTVHLTVSTSAPVQFPLYLRIPRWCAATPELKLHGQPVTVPAQAKPLSYLVINRQWADGDRVDLRLPMSLQLKQWEKNQNAVSVSYGPLTFSLKIGENWTRYGGTDQWPRWDLLPTTPWNYGLVLDPQDPARSFQIVRQEGGQGGLAPQPFTPEAAPIQLQAQARKIPAWKQDATGLLCPLQPSPARSTEPVETVTLIPMGAARLRLSAFPTVSDGPEAHEWVTPEFTRPSASFCCALDNVTALNDGTTPRNSADQSLIRFTWWQHKGTSEWVQYDFPKSRQVSAVEVYWFDDRATGGMCRVPQSWRVLYQDGDTWKPVEASSEYGTKLDTYNRTSFKPIQTTRLRLEVRLQDGFSSGILEWRVVD